MTDREHIQTLLTVARRYWLEQATQAEIAAEIGYSRSMVSRLLDEARRRGIITFTVQHPLERAIELEDALTRTFGLTCARVAMSCLLYTSPSPRDKRQSRMPSSA